MFLFELCNSSCLLYIVAEFFAHTYLINKLKFSDYITWIVKIDTMRIKISTYYPTKPPSPSTSCCKRLENFYRCLEWFFCHFLYQSVQTGLVGCRWTLLSTANKVLIFLLIYHYFAYFIYCNANNFHAFTKYKKKCSDSLD